MLRQVRRALLCLLGLALILSAGMLSGCGGHGRRTVVVHPRRDGDRIDRRDFDRPDRDRRDDRDGRRGDGDRRGDDGDRRDDRGGERGRD